MRTEKARLLFRALYSYTFYLLFMEMFLLSTKRPHVSWVGLLVMAVLFLCSYFLRTHVEHIWPVILFTVAASVGIWLLPLKAAVEQTVGKTAGATRVPEPENVIEAANNSIFAVDAMEQWMLIGLAIGLMFTACHFMARGGILSEAMDVPWPIFVMGLLATAFGFLYDIDGLPRIAAILTGVALIFYLLILYVDGTQKYIDSTKDVRGIPVRQILKVNSWIIVGLFLCMIVAILLGEAVHLPDAFVGFLQAGLSILKAIFYGVVLAFRWIGNLFGFGSRERTHEIAHQMRQEVTKPGMYTNILEFILKGALIALAVFVIIKIISRILRVLSTRYHQRTKAERVVETVQPDRRTKIVHPSFIQRIRESMSMEERARRIYKKRILQYKKEITPSETDTTADIEEKIREEYNVALLELTALYNRVRYGNVTVDRAYLSKMKHADIDAK